MADRPLGLSIVAALYFLVPICFFCTNYTCMTNARAIFKVLVPICTILPALQTPGPPREDEEEEEEEEEEGLLTNNE